MIKGPKIISKIIIPNLKNFDKENSYVSIKLCKLGNTFANLQSKEIYCVPCMLFTSDGHYPFIPFTVEKDWYLTVSIITEKSCNFEVE